MEVRTQNIATESEASIYPSGLSKSQLLIFRVNGLYNS